MNWGKYLVAGMGSFMLFIISMGVYMFTQPADDYDKQYYEKGLTFDHDYVREKQVAQDKAQPVISFSDNNLIVRFTQPADGSVKFEHASNHRLDKMFSIQSNAGNVVSIPLEQLSTGQWHLRFEWASLHKNYLYEQEVYLP
ncbi:nitrogen fixation protein FixH [Mucilaginibacter robiniae]|uniref:Nitrogen fixation protein FixH n=1 Tax=Mucilaginibacter robiniae TaxID=2728022 RepID=A0A7L5E6E2_9SPHI|nr:FixH family protein [Mucilaginibacter robiniae]QJD98208.1 nitrogen fixation protein FixH [Mucilaginibacter robiniae]